MDNIRIITAPITKKELKKIAEERFGDLVKTVVDLKRGIMALGGELHSDEDVLLAERHGSKRDDKWGINLYPDKPREEMIEFDSVINIKPPDNNSRDVEDKNAKRKIVEMVNRLILD